MEWGWLLDLIQRVRGRDRRSALRWLAELNGLQLDGHPLTDADSREYVRRRAQASELAAWKGRLVDALKRERGRWWGIYHGALRYILHNGFEAPLGALAADLNKFSEGRIEILNHEVDVLEAARGSDLLSVFQAQKRRTVA